jgi:hypothetical protein
MIIGIVAENAIFVLHQVKIFQGQGMDIDEALVQAASVRTRPILMTTLAAVFTLLPLALGIGAGAQMQQPLAIAVIGGFSVSSMILFFGLPLIYRLLRRQCELFVILNLVFYRRGRKGRKEVFVKKLRDLCVLSELCGEFFFEKCIILKRD